EFSVRGDIIDIYALNEENPVRIDFFGSEVDRIRFFDPSTQKSLGEDVPDAFILPAQDVVFPPERLMAQANAIAEKRKRALRSIKNEEAKERLDVYFSDLL